MVTVLPHDRFDLFLGATDAEAFKAGERLKRPVDLAAFRRDMETFGSVLAEEEYQNAVGLDDDVDTASIFARFAHLSTPQALADVRAARAAASGAEQRRLLLLEMDVLASVVSEPFAAEEDALATEESKTTVTVAGRTVTYRSVEVVIEDTDDRAERRAWAHAEKEISAGFLPREESLETRYRDAFKKQGYGDDAERFATFHDLDLDAIEHVADALLDATRGVYASTLHDTLQTFEGLAPGDIEGHDVAHTLRAKRLDAFFPKPDVAPALFRTLKRIGFDVAALPNVRLDLADRPNKEARAFVLPCHVPQDVRLVTRPEGGVDDYRSLFHESGHMLHFAFTDGALPYEDRYFGDDGVTESYAYLFEHLLEEPDFVATLAPDLTGDDRAAYYRFAALEKLMGLRYYAAAFKYDRWLASRPLDAAPAHYVEAMTDALLVPQSPIDYLSTDGFYGVWYLHAWLLEATHRAHVKGRFGEQWWQDPDVGAHLTGLYRRGTAPTSRALAEELGGDLKDVRPVVADAKRLLALAS